MTTSAGPGPNTIDTRRLRELLNRVLDHIEAEKGHLIDVDRDHYWLLELRAMFAPDLHEPGSAPRDFGVGQISDDVQSVHERAVELETGDGFVIPWHDLEHAVGLLRALAWMDLPA